MRSVFAFASIVALAGCVTPLPADAPEFSQRAAPREGQNEIELLAGFSGRLAIQDDCLGAVGVRGGDETFVTIVWPYNAQLERDGPSWRVRNTQSGATIRVGQRIEGSGGYMGEFDAASLDQFNRFLTRKLGEGCASKGFFTLNRDFGTP